MREPFAFPAARARASGLILAPLLMLLALAPAAAISIVISTGSGGWTVNVPPANLPTVAGSDISVTTYTSGTNQTILRVNSPFTSGFTGWRVDVSRIVTTWNAGLHLFIRRTNNGTPGGRLVGPLNVYQEVTATPTEFFRCNSRTQITNIRCQLQLQGVSAVVGRSNSASIVYTVTEF
jgi:hypothetical protein